VAELVDALVLGTSTFGVRVRVSPLVKKIVIMAKIYHKEFKQKLDEKNKIDWTNEPKHENKYKSNLASKRKYFKKVLDHLLDNEIIKKCDRSFDICAIKFGPKKSILESTLVLQEYSDDQEEKLITWEYLLYNRNSETYDDSKFFSSSDKAISYFIDKTRDMVDN
tara:strand:- start:2224 stop:2718 length:495 start_codon:yes stop_codon:yes gene_type:complete